MHKPAALMTMAAWLVTRHRKVSKIAKGVVIVVKEVAKKCMYALQLPSPMWL